MGVTGMELVTTGPSQKVKLLCEDASNLSVPTLSAAFVTKEKGLPHPDTATMWTYTAIPIVSAVPIIVVVNQSQHSLPVGLIILLSTELQVTTN